jgi:hypothetical protein
MFDLNFGSRFARFIARTKVAYARRRTEWLISNLPADLRKDIGWPDIAARRGGR